MSKRAINLDDAPATHLVIVLDASGSMANKRADVLGGLAEFLQERKTRPDRTRVSLCVFNTVAQWPRQKFPLSEIEPLTDAEYRCGGGTALLDAVAEAITQAEQDQGPDEAVLVLVLTDGEENSSQRTSRDQLQGRIQEKTAQAGWTFAYLGAAPAEWTGAGSLGLDRSQVYSQSIRTPQDARAAFSAMSVGYDNYTVDRGLYVASARASGNPGGLRGQSMSMDWKARPAHLSGCAPDGTACASGCPVKQP